MNLKVLQWNLNTIHSSSNEFTPPFEMKEAICTIKNLPPLSGVGMQVIDLKNDDCADCNRLAAIVEQDPFLSAMIIRWANSALFGYAGKIVNVNDAVSRVLGFDLLLISL